MGIALSIIGFVISLVYSLESSVTEAAIKLVLQSDIIEDPGRLYSKI